MWCLDLRRFVRIHLFSTVSDGSVTVKMMEADENSTNLPDDASAAVSDGDLGSLASATVPRGPRKGRRGGVRDSMKLAPNVNQRNSKVSS